MDAVSPTRRRLIAATAAGLIAARLPCAGVAQHATPTAAAVDDDGSLPAMLARARDPVLDGGTGPTTLCTYANIARQLEVRGLRPLDSAMADADRLSEWIDGVDGLYLDDVFAQRALQEELWDLIGFDPSQITQTMTVGDPPRVTRIYRGAFDGAAIRRALGASGYERVETPRGPILSIGATGEYSLDDPIQRLVIGAYNNIAAVGDTHVIASPFLADVESALAALAGGEATLATNRAVATLLAALGEELVSATVVDGSYLSVANLPDFAREGIGTPVPAAIIPPAAYAVFGITPGSMPSRYKDEDPQLQGDNDDTAPRSAFILGLHLGSAQEASAAVPVIEARVAEGVSVLTGQPYAELLGEPEVAAVPGTPVVKIRITGDRIGRIWLRMVFSLDLVYVYTE